MGRNDRPTDPSRAAERSADRLGSPDRPTLSHRGKGRTSGVLRLILQKRWAVNVYGDFAGSLVWTSFHPWLANLTLNPQMCIPPVVLIHNPRPTDPPRAALRSKFWVGAIDRPTLFGQATAQRASRPTRPTDPLRAAGGTKYDSDLKVGKCRGTHRATPR